MRFSVRGNPTTGYMWEVNEEATKGAFTVERDYIKDPIGEGEESSTGVGGTFFFTLTAGDSVPDEDVFFQIGYMRNWETENVDDAEWKIKLPIHLF